MFGCFRKGREDGKTFIEDKVRWFHFMEGFDGLFYEHVLSNVFKKYPFHHIEYSEYIESFNYFNKLCEYYSSDFNKRLDKTDDTWIEHVYNIIGTNQFAKYINRYKKGKLFEILLILYITEGHKEDISFTDFIEKWFKDGILVLITDQGDEVKDEMKNRFFDKKSEFSYIYNTKFHRFIFEIERETCKIGLSVFPSYYDYFELNRALDNITKSLERDSTFDALKYSYESQPIAKCQWVSRKKEGIEIEMEALSREDFHKVFGKPNPVFASARLFTDMYEKERNTKRLIRKITGMSNKEYKALLNKFNNQEEEPDYNYRKYYNDIIRLSGVDVNNDFILYVLFKYFWLSYEHLVKALLKLKDKIEDKKR